MESRNAIKKSTETNLTPIFNLMRISMVVLFWSFTIWMLTLPGTPFDKEVEGDTFIDGLSILLALLPFHIVFTIEALIQVNQNFENINMPRKLILLSTSIILLILIYLLRHSFFGILLLTIGMVSFIVFLSYNYINRRN